MYRVPVSPWVQRTVQLHPWYRNTHFYSFILCMEGVPVFSELLQLKPNPYNWAFYRSTWYPSVLGGQRQYGMRSLPNTFIHDHQQESNPRPSGIEFYALSTWPHAPKNLTSTFLSVPKRQWHCLFFLANNSTFAPENSETVHPPLPKSPIQLSLTSQDTVTWLVQGMMGLWAPKHAKLIVLEGERKHHDISLGMHRFIAKMWTWIKMLKQQVKRKSDV